MLALALGTALAIGAVSVNAFGAGDRFEQVVDRLERFVAGPPPDRTTLPTVTVTPRPAATPSASPSPTPRSSAATTAAPTLIPTPSPTPARVAVDRQVLDDPASVFAHEIRVDWCAPAGVQMVLAAHGQGSTSDAFQKELASRVREWESYADSHNGEWGPAAMALALQAYDVPGYEIRAYEKREDALRDAAVALDRTGAPVILLAWRGAHTWVMSGYRADADPAIFPDAAISGAYILDPWYPDHSSIWGQSDPPGAFQDTAEMERNFLPWKRPEGLYKDRDGKFIAVVPTIPMPGWATPSPGPAS